MILQLYLVLLVVWMILWRFKNRKLIKLSKELKCSVPSYPLIGHAYKFLGDDEVQMQSYQEFGREALRLGGVTSMWIVNLLFVVIADPVTAEFCLKNYMEKGYILSFVRDIIGNGSIFAPVSIWRSRRKILVPAFSPKNILQFSKVFAKQASIMVDKISVNADKEPFSIWTYFTTYTMDSVGEATLGVKIDTQKNHDHRFLKAFEVGASLVATRIIRPWLHNKLIFRLTPAYHELESSKKYLYKFIGGIIQSKHKEMEARSKNTEENSNEMSRTKSFLELLIEYSKTEQGYNDLELREEVQILVMAGNDTSAVGASFTALMLARHPDTQQKVYEELYYIFGHSQRLVTPEDLHHMKYLDAVIKETLRLYPPVPLIVRESDRELTLPSGVRIPKGCVLLHNIWAVHRNPQYWGPDAEEFRPERWLEGFTLKHPTQYMAFSFGPRNCLGYQFAMSSMKIVISTLLRRYRLLLGDSPTTSNGCQLKPIRLKFDIMMKDVEKFIVKIQRRN